MTTKQPIDLDAIKAQGLNSTANSMRLLELLKAQQRGDLTPEQRAALKELLG